MASPLPDPTACIERLKIELDRVVDVVTTGDPSLAVPACPDWTVADLAIHLGEVHRWATHLVTTRAGTWVDRAALGIQPPEDPGGLGPWLREGGDRLLDALGDAEPDATMWTWARDRRTAWWYRRQLHETTLHRMDIELAGGRTPTLEAPVASDGLDEFLTNLPDAARFTPAVRELRGTGSIHLHATDVDTAAGEGGEWTMRLTEDGFDLERGHAKGDTAVRGPAVELLLLFTRRSAPDEAAVEVFGDEALLRFWWEHARLG